MCTCTYVHTYIPFHNTYVSLRVKVSQSVVCLGLVCVCRCAFARIYAWGWIDGDFVWAWVQNLRANNPIAAMKKKPLEKEVRDQAHKTAVMGMTAQTHP